MEQMEFNMLNESESTNNMNIDNMDDSENTAKISDSAYSNSCSNSQARSRSSHSTHSGSHTSGSSGYGGKPSTSGYCSNNFSQPSEIRSKTKKKKKLAETEAVVIQEEKQIIPEPVPEVQPIEEQCIDDASSPDPQQMQLMQTEHIDLTTIDRCSTKDKISTFNFPVHTQLRTLDGFSCVISMQDGVVMYTTHSITNALGYPRDMWIGRSFIDFIHPRDRNTFGSQITNGVAILKNVHGTLKKGTNTLSTMVCRIRRYRGLSSGFGVKTRTLSFMPFLLKLSFRNICDEEGDVIYLLMQATPFYSTFKVPNEIVLKAVPFVIRHAANGDIKYIDPESVPYLGYTPQDIINKDALNLYHPHDLTYLRQVYETIVKEGFMQRSKPYRMMAQNGDYVKLETEWSSFINPWSKKLEFVIGKHLLIEGPSNPNVFQSVEKPVNFTEEEKETAQTLKESIIKMMNEILTKPAEAAKQQMTKRCQDLASFMESLMDEAPRTDDEIWLDIKEPDSAYYDFSVQERDSVMLGGISPHHDCSESKSSAETHISFNQLNYSETLQRYFDSHLPYSEYGNVETAENESPCQSNSVGHLSPMGVADFGDMTSSCDSSGILLTCPVTLGNYSSIRLTESALNKHNSVMEKELMKLHREIKSGHKEDRKQSSKESRIKKKEHLARCNASFLPTSAGPSTIESGPLGLKRASVRNSDGNCKRSSAAKMPRHHEDTDEARPVTSTSNAVASSPTVPAVDMNAFLGMQPQMSLMNPVAAVSGVLPVCYVPTTPQPMTANSLQNENTTNPLYPIPCVLYGQPIYTSPMMYTPLNTQMHQMQLMQQIQQMQQLQHMQMQQGMMAQTFNTAGVHPLGLPSANYQEACKLTFPTRNKPTPSTWNEKKAEQPEASVNNGSAAIHSSAGVTKPSTTTTETEPKPQQTASEDTIDKTDESSYSSFYSNFFKSESRSAEESDVKKLSGASSSISAKDSLKELRRKMEPPWMEHVCVTSELIYQYQVLPKNIEDVLSRDQERLKTLEQPMLVNDQLGQLYLDLQLEGVATRLTLEESITSSSSSGEENFVRNAKVQVRRRKREYSKLVMIYEEDAPLPPPEEPASTSTS